MYCGKVYFSITRRWASSGRWASEAPEQQAETPSPCTPTDVPRSNLCAPVMILPVALLRRGSRTEREPFGLHLQSRHCTVGITHNTCFQIQLRGIQSDADRSRCTTLKGKNPGISVAWVVPIFYAAAAAVLFSVTYT